MNNEYMEYGASNSGSNDLDIECSKNDAVCVDEEPLFNDGKIQNGDGDGKEDRGRNDKNMHSIGGSEEEKKEKSNSDYDSNSTKSSMGTTTHLTEYEN